MCEKLESKVKKIVAEVLGVEESDVTPDASFKNELAADSLMQIEIMMAFEEAFGIEIPDEEAEGIDTAAEALACLKGKLALGAGA